MSDSGTGKTTTVIEIIAQEVKRGNKILACASSNVAVDNIVERLSRLKLFKQKIVRVGHPARLLQDVSTLNKMYLGEDEGHHVLQVLSNSLEAHVKKSDNSSLAKDIQKEMKALNSKLMKLESWKKKERHEIQR